jgi:indole-3-glycerol phosphate synthase
MSVSNKSIHRGKILDEIMRHNRERLPKTKRAMPEDTVRAFASVTAPALDFVAALKRPGVSMIAECKKASPSKGLMVQNYDPVALARTYASAGASAISVLTDSRHFQGSLEDLRDVKEVMSAELETLFHGTSDPRYEIGIPILRKDFIFDPYQVYESRAAGADAILLIASVISPAEMRDLLKLTHELGMNALVEVHSEAEIEAVLPLKPRIIGVNNRNLQTFEVDFANTARLRTLIPADIVTVGESGLKTTGDVQTMKEIGVDAILVGETLVKSSDTFRTTRALVQAGRPY